MKITRMSIVFLVFLFALAPLSAFLIAARVLTATAAPPSVNDKSSGSERLAWISEETGLIASLTPVSEACTYDDAYEVYLCPEPKPAVSHKPDPEARARALSLLGSTGLLLIPDSTGDRVMAFDPQTGDLVDANFIPSDPLHLTTPINAILSAGRDTVLVSDQIRDLVLEYGLDGNYIGVFAPAGGPDASILDNIRGIALRPNGNLLVTVGAGTNRYSVAEFDTAGNYVGNFVAEEAGGLASPFDIYMRTGDWLVGGSSSFAIHRYELNSGAYIADFAQINNFPEQIFEIEGGNILVADFLGTQEGVVEFTSAGAVVGVYNPEEIGGNRGVYELPNGNILTTNDTGVYEIDRAGMVVIAKTSGVNARFIELVGASLVLRKTVGLNSSTCATADTIAVEPGTTVYYCYEITNTGSISLTTHDLVDSHLGTLLSGFPYTLLPGASAFLTASATISQTTVNIATWSAQPGSVLATDVATVTLPLADLSLAKSDTPDPAAPGQTLTYTLTISNSGPTDASSVVLTDTLPAAVTFVASVPDQGSCLEAAGMVTCDLGALSAGTSMAVVIVVLAPEEEGTITNTATVAADQEDPNLANNTVSQDTMIEIPQYDRYLPVLFYR